MSEWRPRSVARLGDVRKGLKDQMATITGLHTYAVVPASPQTPCAAVSPRSRELFTQDGLWRYFFSIYLYFNPSDVARAQTAFDTYLTEDGSNSILTALEADQSLGGIAQYAVVTGWTEYVQPADIAGGQLLSGRIDVEVVA